MSPFTENNTYQNVNAFHKQPVLNHAPRNLDDEKRALTYLDKYAPDLVGMILGGVL